MLSSTQLGSCMFTAKSVERSRDVYRDVRNSDTDIDVDRSREKELQAAKEDEEDDVKEERA